MNRWSASLLSLTLLLAWDRSALAQGTDSVSSSAAIPDNAACEIELFVAKRYGAETPSGGGFLQTLIMASLTQAGDQKAETELMGALPPEKIKAIFLETDLTAVAQREVVKVNYNSLSDDQKVVRNLIKSKGRSTNSNADCYHEIFIPEISMYRGLGIVSNTLFFDIYFKKFSGAIINKTFKATMKKSVGGFPAKNGESKEEANKIAVSKFQEAVAEFFAKKVK